MLESYKQLGIFSISILFMNIVGVYLLNWYTDILTKQQDHTPPISSHTRPGDEDPGWRSHV